jgi:cation transporter-like permease
VRGRSEGIVTAIVAGIVVVPLLWVLAVALSLVWTLATRAIVLEQVGVGGALRRGFSLLWHRSGRMALLWLIALGLAIASGIAASLAAGLLLLPFLAILAGTYAVAGVSATLTVGAILFFLYIVLSVFLNGAVGSFLTSYWTLAYRRLDLDPTPAGPPQPAVA